MNSSNPQLPQAPPVQPIHDVAPPPTNSLGNPENLANIPVHQAPGEQPSASQPAAQMPAAAPVQPTQAQAEDIDKVLKDVNKDVKAEDKPKKVQKSSNRPILAITMAIIVGLALSAAAYYAYNSAN